MTHRAFLVVFILLTSCATHRIGLQGKALSRASKRTQVSYELHRDLTYKTFTNYPPLTADLYRPHITGSVPVVLVVHGGGWVRGKRTDMNFICRRLAKRGYAVLNVSYRFAPAFHFPAQLADLQAALRWLDANKNQYRLDTSKVGGFGYSAGAHLVSLLGVLDKTDSLSDEIDYSSNPIRLKAIVAGGNPADLTRYPRSPLVTKLMGFEKAGHEKEYERASVTKYLSKDDPPFFLYHGRIDQLVEYEQMTLLAERLQAVGVTVETYTVPLLGHVPLFVLNRESAERGIDFLDRTL